METHECQRTRYLLWPALAVTGLLATLARGSGCRRKEAAPQAPPGAIYYRGPMNAKGGGSPAPNIGR